MWLAIVSVAIFFISCSKFHLFFQNFALCFQPPIFPKFCRQNWCSPRSLPLLKCLAFIVCTSAKCYNLSTIKSVQIVQLIIPSLIKQRGKRYVVKCCFQPQFCSKVCSLFYYCFSFTVTSTEVLQQHVLQPQDYLT